MSPFDSPEITDELIKKQKQNLREAQLRKGQKPTNKRSRLQLEFKFLSLDSKKQPEGHDLRQSFISYAYPPSTTPFTQLKPIKISDLVLETHHTGKVLIVKTFCTPTRLSAVQNAVEDEDGNVDRLALYNADPDLAPDKLLPKGAIVAVKEPFYKGTADGGYVIRVDHPSDLVHLQPLHSMVPDELRPKLVELDRTAVDWKKEGNAAYGKKDYYAAVELYTSALEACTDRDKELNCDLLRNRAVANLCLKRYDPALDDAKASLISDVAEDDSRARELNGKAHYRAGRAAYELGRYDEADHHFEALQSLDPEDEDAKNELKRMAQRKAEQALGAFDFEKMSKSASKKHNRLDHASFVSKVEVRDAGECGRGLFAKEAVQPGDLVMCEKAFCISFNSEVNGTNIVVNLNTGRMTAGTHAVLLFSAVQKLLYSPSAATQFFELYGGGYTPKCAGVLVDGMVAVDTFQVEAISEHNAFGCPTVRSSTDTAAKAEREESVGQGSSGIWTTASYINHACDGNVVRSFIGDMMILRATKKIAIGDEITMPYRLLNADHNKTQEDLQSQWRFRCKCKICAAEENGTAAQRRERAKLVKETQQLWDLFPPTFGNTPSVAVVREAEALFLKLEGTYDSKVFENVPKYGLVELGLWLLGSMRPGVKPNKVLDTALSILRNAGYGVSIKGDHVQFDHTHCQLVTNLVDASIHAAQAYIATGKDKLGAQFVGFAKGLYRTVYGEIRGFDKRYGSL